MMRRMLIVAVAAFLSIPASANASRLIRQCRRECAAAIASCHSTSHASRHKCQKILLRACKSFGIVACELAPPTTTTSTVPTTSTLVTTSTTTSTSTSSTTTTLPDRLNLLLGRWAFTYTIINTFTDHYGLTAIVPSAVGPYNIVVGTNLDYGNQVIAAKTQDLAPGNTSGYEFALLDPESSICEFFAFNVAGASSASGVVLFFYGDCQTPISGNAYNFSGLKY